MSVTSFSQKMIVNLAAETLVFASPSLTRIAPLRRAAIQAGAAYIRLVYNGSGANPSRPPGVIADRAQFGQAILHTTDRIFANGLSQTFFQRAGNIVTQALVVDGKYQSARSRFFERYGTYPPYFLTLSPGKTCNLKCVGCYASAGSTHENMDWSIFDRIITEAKTLWGSYFFVISGGEPLAYRSEGKGILDAAEKHPDCFFLMYTNGTLISDKVAERMASLGNITPAISVEGWRERTDERRGAGVFDKVLSAMGRLRRAGVPFGISLTATRHNAEEILSDDFINFFFEQQGALYGWIFQYMPIGRSFTLDLMPTPQQRIWMWKRTWEIIRERQIFLADFWNSASLSDGCIAAGRTRGGGYLYIDWNGAVTPCVFVPYSPVNIKDVYAKGGNLNDVWSDPFFADIRCWQEDYRQCAGNWLAPCINRDHHNDLLRLIAQREPDPIDENALKALLDPEYICGLENYDQKLQELSGPIWDERYLCGARR